MGKGGGVGGGGGGAADSNGHLHTSIGNSSVYAALVTINVGNLMAWKMCCTFV